MKAIRSRGSEMWESNKEPSQKHVLYVQRYPQRCMYRYPKCPLFYVDVVHFKHLLYFLHSDSAPTVFRRYYPQNQAEI